MPCTKEEEHDFGRMLYAVNLLYLGGTVLVLLDEEYLQRFWTSAEAWLSMRTCTATGLASAQHFATRCKINVLPGSAAELKGALVGLWADSTVEQACHTLASDGILVTNQSDKEKLLLKLRKLHEIVRGAWASMQEAKLKDMAPILDGIIDKPDAKPLMVRAGWNAKAEVKSTKLSTLRSYGRVIRTVVTMPIGARLLQWPRSSTAKSTSNTAASVQHFQNHLEEAKKMSASELKAAGFDAGELKAAGFNARGLKERDFTAKRLLEMGFNISELIDAGFDATELKEADVTALELVEAKPVKPVKFTADDLKTAGFGATELRIAGFSAAQLKEAKFTAGELKEAKFNAKDLMKASGLKWHDVGAAKPGLGFNELVNEALSAELQKKTDFSSAEWNAFKIRELHLDHFIKADKFYFQPAVTALF